MRGGREFKCTFAFETLRRQMLAAASTMIFIADFTAKKCVFGFSYSHQNTKRFCFLLLRISGFLKLWGTSAYRRHCCCCYAASCSPCCAR